MTLIELLFKLEQGDTGENLNVSDLADCKPGLVFNVGGLTGAKLAILVGSLATENPDMQVVGPAAPEEAEVVVAEETPPDLEPETIVDETKEEPVMETAKRDSLGRFLGEKTVTKKDEEPDPTDVESVEDAELAEDTEDFFAGSPDYTPVAPGTTYIEGTSGASGCVVSGGEDTPSPDAESTDTPG